MVSPKTLNVDETFRIPDRGDYTDNSPYKRSIFQSAVVDELYEKIADQPVDSEDEIKSGTLYRVDAILHITYYHAVQDKREAIDGSVRGAFNNSSLVVDHLLSFEDELIQTPTESSDEFVESLDFNRRFILDKKYGLSPTQVPVRHIFSITYYTGNKLGYEI